MESKSTDKEASRAPDRAEGKRSVPSSPGSPDPVAAPRPQTRTEQLREARRRAVENYQTTADVSGYGAISTTTNLRQPALGLAENQSLLSSSQPIATQQRTTVAYSLPAKATLTLTEQRREARRREVASYQQAPASTTYAAMEEGSPDSELSPLSSPAPQPIATQQRTTVAYSLPAKATLTLTEQRREARRREVASYQQAPASTTYAAMEEGSPDSELSPLSSPAPPRGRDSGRRDSAREEGSKQPLLAARRNPTNWKKIGEYTLWFALAALVIAAGIALAMGWTLGGVAASAATASKTTKFVLLLAGGCTAIGLGGALTAPRELEKTSNFLMILGLLGLGAGVTYGWLVSMGVVGGAAALAHAATIGWVIVAFLALATTAAIIGVIMRNSPDPAYNQAAYHDAILTVTNPSSTYARAELAADSNLLPASARAVTAQAEEQAEEDASAVSAAASSVQTPAVVQAAAQQQGWHASAQAGGNSVPASPEPGAVSSDSQVVIDPTQCIG